MIYFIGGVSRAGKSTFARAVRRHTNAYSLAGDAFRIMIRSKLSESDNPILWRKTQGLIDPVAYIDFFVNHTPQAIENMRQEAAALWGYFEQYLSAFAIESKDDLIIESVDLHPEFISQCRMPHRAYFFC